MANDTIINYVKLAEFISQVLEHRLAALQPVTMATQLSQQEGQKRQM